MQIPVEVSGTVRSCPRQEDRIEFADGALLVGTLQKGLLEAGNGNTFEIECEGIIAAANVILALSKG